MSLFRKNADSEPRNDNSYEPKGQGSTEQGGTGPLKNYIEETRQVLKGAPEVKDNKIGGQPVDANKSS